MVPVAVVHALWIAFFDNHDLGLAISAVAVCAYFWLIAALVRTRKAPMSYCIFAIGCVVLPAYTGTWLGFPRFGLVIFPLFWMLALWGENDALRQRRPHAVPRTDGRIRIRLLRCGNLHAMRSEVETYGVTSSVARLRRVLVRTPATSGDFAGAGWRRPDPGTLLRQHAAFCELLSDLGCEVVVAPAGRGPRRRLLHVRLGVHDRRRRDRAALGRSPTGRPSGSRPRRRWPTPACRSCAHLTGDARADGGDLFFLDDRTLVAGRGYRTNAAAHRQLAEVLDAARRDASSASTCRTTRGPAHVLHTMSFISPVADDLAVVFERLMPVPLVELLARARHPHGPGGRGRVPDDGLQRAARAARRGGRRRRQPEGAARHGGGRRRGARL